MKIDFWDFVLMRRSYTILCLRLYIYLYPQHSHGDEKDSFTDMTVYNTIDKAESVSAVCHWKCFIVWICMNFNFNSHFHIIFACGFSVDQLHMMLEICTDSRVHEQNYIVLVQSLLKSQAHFIFWGFHKLSLDFCPYIRTAFTTTFNL